MAFSGDFREMNNQLRNRDKILIRVIADDRASVDEQPISRLAIDRLRGLIQDCRRPLRGDLGPE